MLKQCTKCLEFKENTEFTKRKTSKDGLSNWCKACQSAYDKNRRLSPERQEYCKQHREKYYKEHAEHIKQQQRQYYQNNKEYYKEYDKIRNSQPERKAYIQKRNIEYYQKNRLELNEKDRIRSFKRRQNIDYRLHVTVSSSMYYALKHNKNELHWESLVPYTIQELKEHLESQFTSEMNWNNYGTYWEIDHIIPRNMFNITNFKDEQFQICWSLANLRPLEKSLNRQRPKDGSDISEEIKQNILGQRL